MKRAALNRARAYLTNTVAEYRRRGEQRLPTVGALAAQASVSRNVLLRALEEVSEREGLTRRPGSGIWIGPAPSSPTPVCGVDVGKPQWQLIADAVARDVELGIFAARDRVPAVKELRARYGGCYRTMRKALDDLLARRVIVRRGACCSFPSPAPEQSSGSVVLIAAGSNDGTITFDNTRSAELYRSLCSAVSRHRVSFVPYSYMSWDDNLFDPVSKKVISEKEIAGRHTVLGYVFWDMGMPKPENYVRMVRRLLRLGRPVVVIDEAGEAEFAGEFTGQTKPLVVSLATGPSCGLVMGRYLVARGHRRIAYISYHHALRWSEARLAGLRECARSAAAPVEIVPVVSTDYTMEHMLVHIQRYSKSLARPMERLVQKVRATFDNPWRAEVELREALNAMIDTEAIQNMLLPLFGQAVNEQGVTAWACANDATALAALSFLRARGGRNPAPIAVAGFDDSTDAFLANLTSHNFDLQGVSHIATRHLLFPPSRPTRGEPVRIVEAEGFVVQRESA